MGSLGEMPTVGFGRMVILSLIDANDEQPPAFFTSSFGVYIPGVLYWCAKNVSVVVTTAPSPKSQTYDRVLSAFAYSVTILPIQPSRSSACNVALGSSITIESVCLLLSPLG